MNRILCKEAGMAMKFVVLMLVLAGCARTPYFNVRTVSKESTVAGSEALPVTFKVSLSMDYPEAKGDTTHVITAFRHAIVERAFGPEFDTLDVETAAQVYVERLKADFGDFAEKMQSAGMYGDGAEPEVTEWYDSMTGYFAGSKGHYSSYMIEYSGYSGGARPDQAATGLVFDLVEGKLLTLLDIFKPDAEAALSSLIQSHAAECVPEGAAEVVYTPLIAPISNFVLTGKSITFIYNPGVVGPVGLGVVQITVPLSECRKAGTLVKGF